MSIIKNKIFIYISSKYLTFGLQFILSLIIAYKLGPYYLGVYGVVTLIISYITQINFGISHSLNVFLVHNKNDKNSQNKYIINSFILFFYLSIFVLIFYVAFDYFYQSKWGEYELSNYIVLIVLISILTFINSVFSTVIRVLNMVNLMSLLGIIPVVLNFFAVVVFSGERLVIALTVANMLSVLVSMIICMILKTVQGCKLGDVNIGFQKEILLKGLFLFLYNSSFSFILLVVRTFVSSNYTVEEFGYFTFSYTIANAIMLLLSSLNIIIFPKTIDLLSSQSNTDKIKVLKTLRVGYVSTAYLLIYFAMIFFPLFLMFFPKYELALCSMNMVALSVLMSTNSYGYGSLLIAQNKEKIISYISLLSLLLTIVIGLVLVKLLEVDFSYVIISMLISYLFFSFVVTYVGNNLLGRVSWNYILKDFFPINLLFPYLSALVISIFKFEALVFFPLLIFILLNYKDLGFLKNMVVKMVKNPNVIDV